MGRASSLPEQLHYLQPFRRKFASRRPEELDEDSGWIALKPLLSKRVRGLELDEAGKILDHDLAALREWLAEPAQEHDPLHFVLGVSLIASGADLIRHIQEEAEEAAKPKLCLQMELPPGAKRRRVEGSGDEGMLVSWRELLFVVEALSQEAAANLGDPMTRSFFPGILASVSTISLGTVSGHKFIVNGESWSGPFKKVEYILTVPGGHVSASVSSSAKKTDELNWDETKLEAYFHTLRLVTVPTE